MLERWKETPHEEQRRGRDGATAGAGTDQHVTGTGESGSFITDEPPTSTTPANGSSNAGINALRANREAPGRGPEAMATDDHTEPA